MTPGRPLASALAAVLLLTGCTSSTTPSAGTAGPAPTTAPGTCPDRRAGPDDARPVVDLRFVLADDLRSVSGTETVRFTADRDTDELVFRLVPNAPESAARGTSLAVDDARGPDVEGAGYETAGAAGPGGLYVVQLDGGLEAGESTEVTLEFTVTLGEGGFDRLGTATELAWWASGFPLLAWEPGVGWARDPFVAVGGETASSPVADTTIAVDAPERLTVLMTGRQDDPVAAGPGRRRWTSHEPVARDVSVAAGPFRTADVVADGVRVTVGTLPGATVEAPELAAGTVTAIDQLTDRFGTFPYETLTVAALPDYGGGIEYPSAILMASGSNRVLVHEVAHMWFYGMVGGSQFRDPWLDEAFASYAESVAATPDPARVERALAREAAVGGSMADFTDDDSYVAAVYGKGAAALLSARDAAGPAAFDAAVRCYVDANAWTTATPDDVADALADLPAALDVLVDAGALTPVDLPARAGTSSGVSSPTD